MVTREPWIWTTLVAFTLSLGTHAAAPAKTSAKAAPPTKTVTRESPMAAAKHLIFPMSKGSLIEVEDYIAETNFYEIKDVVYYGQGPWYTTPEQLARAVHALSLDRITRQPLSVVNNQYTTDEVMMLAAGPGRPRALRPKPKPKATTKKPVGKTPPSVKKK